MTKATKYLPAYKRRQATVQATLELAAKHAPTEITTAKIAARMGMSQAAVFRHFSTKSAVWEEVMRWVARELMEQVQQAAAPGPPALNALEAVFLAHVAFVAQYPGVPRILFAELQQVSPTPVREIVWELVRDYGLLVASLLERGRQSGEIDSSISTETASSMFLGAVQGLIIKGLLSCDMDIMTRSAPATYALFRRSIELKQ
jgi:AcrR family transcriptional regulator